MNEWFEFRDLIWLIMTYYYDLMLRKFEKHLMPLDTMAPGTPFAAVSQTTGVSFGNMTSCPWLDRPWPAHLSRNSFLKPCGNNPRVPRGHDWITCGYLWFVADQHLLRWMLSWYLLEFLWPSNSFWYPKEMLHLFGDDTQSGCLWPMAIRLVFRRTGPGIEVNDGSWGVLKTCDAIYSIGLSIYQFINRLFYISIYLYLSLSISIYLSLSTSIYLPLSIYLSFYLSIFLSFYLSISFYIFLFLSISIYMFLSIVSDHIFSYLIYLSISISISLLHPKDSAEVAIRESNIRGGVVPDGVQLGSQCHRGPGNKVWTHHGQSTLDSFPKMEVSKAADSKMMIFFTLFEPQLPSNGWLIYLIFTMCRSTCLCTTVSSSVCVFDEKSELGGLYLREQCTVPCSLKQSTVDRIKNYDKIPEKSCRKVMNSVLLVQNCTSYKARAILPACSRCRHRRRTAGGTQQNRARFCVMVPQSLRCYFDLIECYLHLIRCFTGDMKVHEARIFVNIWLQYITVWIVIRTWVSVLLSLKLLRLQTCIRTLSTRSMFKRSL